MTSLADGTLTPLLFQFPRDCRAATRQGRLRQPARLVPHPQIDAVVDRLRALGALTVSLVLYRAILPPESLLGPPPQLPPIQAPTLGVWGSEDFAVTEQGSSTRSAPILATSP